MLLLIIQTILDCKKITNNENKIDQSFFKNETEENKIIDLVREQLYQYMKYQQMLEENVFQNSSQKKLVQSKYRKLKQSLSTYLNENENNIEIIDQLIFEIPRKLNYKAFKQLTETETESQSRFRRPFKWG